MADVAASVLARLKNKAAKSGRSYQLCLQLFCQEEFLRRLEKSKYAENLVLKGGLFLYSLTDFDSRVTADVDFLLRKMPNTPEQLQAILEEIIATETGNDFITFEIKTVAPIAVAKKYAGIGASLVARIKNTKTPFGIDFGVGDIIVPRQEKRKIPTQLDGFEAPTVNTYSLETTVAEKLDAILSLMEFSSRMKDYYDLYYLANKFDFDGATLTEALQKTFENREHLFTVEQFEQVMAFGSDDAMQKKWKAFCRKIDTKTDDYNTVLSTIKAFLVDPYKAAVAGKKYTESWSAYNGSWTQGGNNNAELKLDIRGGIGTEKEVHSASREIITKTLHDAAFDIAYDSITPVCLTSNGQDQDDYGAYVELTRVFDVVDFDYLERIFSKGGLIEYLKKTEKEKIETTASVATESLNRSQQRSNSNAIRAKIKEAVAASGKQYDGIKEIIDMVRQIIPYNRMLISSDGYLIPLDDRYFRIDAQNLGFKYGGEITCVGMITNIIGEDTDPNDSQNIFATLQFSVNEVLRQLLPTKERNLCVIHPIAVYYGN